MSTERVDVGRRTGVKVTSDVAHTQDGIEDPVRFFETAQSPSTSVESGKENHSSASTVVAVKPQKKIRFSLDEDVADVTPTFDSQHHGPNLVRAPRGSLNSSHLSVPTAVALVTQHGEDDEDSKVEISRNSVDEEETGASADMEEIVAQQKRQQSLSPGDFPMGDVPDDEFTDNNEEDDDLVPPPPPDSPDRDEDDEIAAEADETASTKSRVSFSTDDLTKHNANDDFHTQIDDYEENDDDDKEGPGFQIKEREKECVGGDEDSETESVQKRRHLKERTKLDKKKQDAASARSKNSRKKKKMTVSIHESIDDDSEDQTKTPATKKRKPKKKINPFASSFSPKGIPLPRSYTSIPVSDCKEDSPEDKNLRRSKRARTSPLEFWRGEKPVYGANSFSDDYDGVRNMPVVVGFTKADPTPYKKRKVPATVPKKKAGKNGTKEVVAYVEDEPFDTSRLRSKLKINDGKIAQLWDERYQDTRSISTYYFVDCCHFCGLQQISRPCHFSRAKRLCRTTLQRERAIYPCPGRARSPRARWLEKRRNPSTCLTKRTPSFQATLLEVSYFHLRALRMPRRLDYALKSLRSSRDRPSRLKLRTMTLITKMKPWILKPPNAFCCRLETTFLFRQATHTAFRIIPRLQSAYCLGL